MCQLSYVIYLIECMCGKKYVGHTIQRLHKCANKYLANIWNKTISRYCAIEHQGFTNPYRILTIDHVDPSINDRFQNLKKERSIGCTDFRHYIHMG